MARAAHAKLVQARLAELRAVLDGLRAEAALTEGAIHIWVRAYKGGRSKSIQVDPIEQALALHAKIKQRLKAAVLAPTLSRQL